VYDPEIHWTSSLRRKAGLSPFTGNEIEASTLKKMKLSPRFNMMALLDEFAYTQSTKECDKLFTLLRISSDVETTAFDPDYSSSIETIARRYAPSSSVYTEVVNPSPTPSPLGFLIGLQTSHVGLFQHGGALMAYFQQVDHLQNMINSLHMMPGTFKSPRCYD
jgi:hypothetical protein